MHEKGHSSYMQGMGGYNIIVKKEKRLLTTKIKQHIELGFSVPSGTEGYMYDCI